MKKKIKTLKDLAIEAGINNFRCKRCGKKVNGLDAVKLLFDRISDYCINGGIVKITKFGIFRRKIHKSKIITTPILKSGKTISKEQTSIGFKPAKSLKVRKGDV